MKQCHSGFIIVLLMLVPGLSAALGTEYHVSVTGKDDQDGSRNKPWRTISAAARVAQPGDVITVHAGTYREQVSPPRGGDSDTRRIIYQAAAGERVQLKGSEVVKTWIREQGDIWKVILPSEFFGAFNPYADLIQGDWFDGRGRQHHTGAVYLNGNWLNEAAKLEEVLSATPGKPLWFATVDKERTSIWARFKGVNPNEQFVEINVRQAVFYPEETGINYLTVRGFEMRQAATPWAPPTAGQVGLIGTHWSRGWIIENNIISHSKCVGIALGKYGDEWDNQSANSAEGYVKTLERALQNGWNRETIGHHVVRSNDISHCEQAGIVGSLGAVFSQITGNTIHDIHVQRLFTGAEMAGIKLHAAIDVEIRGNHIHHTCRGLWLDWMAQGTRVTSNLLHDNAAEDLFVEVDHGPFLVDNNIFLSPVTLNSRSQGGAYVHNLIAGEIRPNDFDGRLTPFHQAHSTALAGMHDNPMGDDRFYNNVFVQRADLSKYDGARMPVAMAGNVFLHGAKPAKLEISAICKPDFDPTLELTEQATGTCLKMGFDEAWGIAPGRQLVTSAVLGVAVIPQLPFENPDGSALRIDTDYSGKARDLRNPTAGPLERPGNGVINQRLTGGLSRRPTED